MWSAIAVGLSHMFCCILPGVISLLALLSGFGVIATLPVWMESLHALTHNYELYIIGFSGLVVIIGWASILYSKKEDCHKHGCDHGSCQPRKKVASKVLIVATLLFFVNVTVYALWHEDGADIIAATHEHDHDH